MREVSGRVEIIEEGKERGATPVTGHGKI